MRAPGSMRLAILLLVASSGCSLLVSAQLSDKPGETGGAGGQGGDATASSTPASSTVAHSSSAVSSSAASSSSSSNGGGNGGNGGGCSGNMVTCLGNPMICKVDLQNDPKNCGVCFKMCFPPTGKCNNGACTK
jgi:hypothetical protein